MALILAELSPTWCYLVTLAKPFHKGPSTPAKPEQAVLTGIRQITETAGLDVSKVTEVVHGTTVGSNTLLQKVGAKTGLITTKGFRDVLEIGRVRTPTMFDLSWEKAVPLIARRFRLEVDERSTADGRILKPLNEQEVIEIGRFFESEGVESVAICFLNSYRNPENETRALEVMNKHFPNMWVTASVSVLPEIREYERTSTTAVNAYVLPSLRAYFERLENGLREIGVSAPLLISNSNGGLSSAKMAQEKPVFFISSAAPPVWLALDVSARPWVKRISWSLTWAEQPLPPRSSTRANCRVPMNTSSAPVFRRRAASSRPAAISCACRPSTLPKSAAVRAPSQASTKGPHARRPAVSWRRSWPCLLRYRRAVSDRHGRQRRPRVSAFSARRGQHET